MNRPLAALTVTCALLFAPGALIPAAAARDPRLVTRHFNPDEVITIAGRAGVQAAISFADDEHIENVAIGDANAWQVTPNKRANILFVKPLSTRGRTNLTVVTDRHTYLFDLVAGSTAQPLYVLRFTYPAEPKSPARSVPGTISEVEAQALVQPPQETAPTVPAPLNFAWKARGNRKLVPARVFDDGSATFLTWDARSPLPAILIRNEKGEEGAVNYAVRDGVIVLDSVPRTIVLRAGKALATLENQGGPRLSAATVPLSVTVPSSKTQGQ